MRRVFTEIARDHAITEIALPVMGFDVAESGGRPSGSAVIVAPYLAVTALHVIQDYRRFFENRVLNKEAAGEMSFAIILHQYRDGQLFSWRAVRMRAADPLDIAVLELIPTHPLPPTFTWRVPEIQLTPPHVGERVQAIGYPLSRMVEDAEGKRWEQTPVVSTGIVREVHAKQRDAGMNRFPCFQTDARFDGGMSGGPVFTADRRLCGIVCSSLPSADESEEHASFVSLLWPLLGMNVAADPSDVDSQDPIPLDDISRNGQLRIHDPQVVSRDGQLGTVSLRVDG